MTAHSVSVAHKMKSAIVHTQISNNISKTPKSVFKNYFNIRKIREDRVLLTRDAL